MAAPERKYTDADVRADMELTELALEYLDTYAGDFDPLVRAQDVLLRGGVLTTSQIRVVLNCMRHDWNIADQMPTPMAKVIDMPVRDEIPVLGYMEPKPKKRKKKPSYQDRYISCDDPKPHPSHRYEADGFDDWMCPGVRNDRVEVVIMKAKIKVPYAKAKGGKMIHLVDPYGDSYFMYSPNRHGDGYGSGFASKTFPFPWGIYPSFHVELMCRYPSWLKDPLLLAEIPEGMLTSEGKPIGLCPHCKKAEQW